MKNSPAAPEPPAPAPAPAPAVAVEDISDPTAVGDSWQFLEQDVIQLASKPFRARRVVVRLGSGTVLFHATSVPVRARTRLPDGLMAYVAFGPYAGGTLNGLRLGPDRLLATAPGIEVQLFVSEGYESVAFLLPPDSLPRPLQQRRHPRQLPEGVDLLTPSPPTGRNLFRWGRRLIDLAARQPDLFDAPLIQAAASAELRDALWTALHATTPASAAPQDRTRQSQSRIVQLAEDLVLSTAWERLHMVDLCEATGVCERTLQYAFKQVTGMSPVAYLTKLRLHRVRLALRAATHGTTTVTAVAMQHGFWHFGDFTRAYKKCFGELPSDTLQRPPGAKPMD